jgi:hypothetical protein
MLDHGLGIFARNVRVVPTVRQGNMHARVLIGIKKNIEQEIVGDAYGCPERMSPVPVGTLMLGAPVALIVGADAMDR